MNKAERTAKSKEIHERAQRALDKLQEATNRISMIQSEAAADDAVDAWEFDQWLDGVESDLRHIESMNWEPLPPLTPLRPEPEDQ